MKTEPVMLPPLRNSRSSLARRHLFRPAVNMGWTALWLVALCGLFTSCDDPKEGTSEPKACVFEVHSGGWLEALECGGAFAALSSSASNNIGFANTHSVKFVMDLQDNDRVYFIDTKEYSLHYYFCRDNLDVEGKDPVGTHAEFNQKEYRSQDRRFLLGTIVNYADQGVVTLEFATGDTIEPPEIRYAFNAVKDKVYFGEQLLYRPVSIVHEQYARDELQDELPVIFTDELYAGIDYQPLNPTTSYGYLRLLGGVSPDQARSTDIVVLKEAPNDIRPVAGVITERFQTPLSHVNILSQNRGTPNMALRDALSDPRITGHKDQLVRLEVRVAGFSIEPATLEEAEAYWASQRPTSTFVPPLDESVRVLVPLYQAGVHWLPAIGAKAANLAEMYKIEGVPLPESAFAVPFVHYKEHLAETGLQEEVDAMLADPRFSTDLAWRTRQLLSLRTAIEEAPMSPQLETLLSAAVAQRWDPERKIRFRSSTNSEDLPNFNGAGLYRSYSGQLVGGRKPSEAVRKVWASLWTDEAVAEREFYRIDHTQVAMAVLVHPSTPDEAANGVALTINPFNVRRPAFFVNVQEGEASVTNPGPGDVPDQFLIYSWYGAEPEIEYLSYSNLNDGEPVLTPEEIAHLNETLDAIHDHFRAHYGDLSKYGMDVEFKILKPDRRLLIKQARPIPAGL